MKTIHALLLFCCTPIFLSSCFVPGIGMIEVGNDAANAATEAGEKRLRELEAEAVARRSAAGVSEQQYENYVDAYIRNLRRTGDATVSVEAARQEAGISRAAHSAIHGGSTNNEMVSDPTARSTEAPIPAKNDTNANSRTATSSYPKGIKIPNHIGFVFNPYTQKIVDVTSLPSGTLVTDPTDPQQRRFIVP